MKIVFMGTPEFAAGALEALIKAGHEIVAVVTQPDRPKGRSKELLAPPVKVCALEHGIPVMQPIKIKKPEAVAELKRYPADINIVAAVGQILNQQFLDISRVEALPLLEAGKLIPQKQDDSASCYASIIEKTMGEIDFSRSAVAIDRLIRGMTPWPSAYTFYKGKQLKIWKAVPETGEEITEGKPGEILRVDKEAVTVAAGEGSLKILELQLEGKKRMTAHDFLLGVRMVPGDMLGNFSQA